MRCGVGAREYIVWENFCRGDEDQHAFLFNSELLVSRDLTRSNPTNGNDAKSAEALQINYREASEVSTVRFPRPQDVAGLLRIILKPS